MYVSIGPNGSSTALTPGVINNSSGGDIVAVSATVGTIIRVYKLFLVVGGVSNITFKDNATALCGALPLAANGSITLDMDGNPWFATAAGDPFIINSSAMVQVSGTIYYTQSQF